MSAAKGKNLEFWYNLKEYPVNSVNAVSPAFDTSDNSDTADRKGKTNAIHRASRSFTVEANLYEPDGGEVATGSLVVNTIYRVTLGTITETQGAFTVGRIFKSDGTGTASAENKVKPLGAKVPGDGMSLVFNDIPIPLTDVDFTVKADEIDSTDNSTATGIKEVDTGLSECDSKITGILKETVADAITSGVPTYEESTLTFGAGCTVDGSLALVKKTIDSKYNASVKVDYEGKWLGIPVLTNIGFCAVGDSHTFQIIQKRGTTTHKEQSGTAICTSIAVKGAFNGNVTVTYTFTINGALTESVAN